jgi:hypothetical protein
VSTRVISGGDRADSGNRATIGIVGLRRQLRRSFEELFIANYDGIKEVLTRFDQPGVAAVAIDSRSGKLESSAWIAAKTGVPNSAIIGRHSMADLFLSGDPSISLRHLALIVEPVSSWERADVDLSFMILDLRTSEGFDDEHGRRLAGLRVEGPAFIRCGDYAIFFLVTHPHHGAWPDSARDAWQCLPERVYLEERMGDGTGSHGYRQRVAAERERMSRGKGNRRTFIQRTMGPITVDHDLLRGDEDALGELRVRTASKSSTFSVGAAAARDGILLGRYERCERAGVLADARISRVHVLLIEIADQLWAIDVASTCGTWRINDKRRLVESRVTAMKHRSKLILADRVAELKWKDAPGR